MARAFNYLHKAPEYLVALALVAAGAWTLRSGKGLALCGVVLVLLLTFFRGWQGHVVADPHVITCPCDGKVLRVVRHRNLGYTQVAVFLNVHNIHVQYMPMDGVVKSIQHKKGEFHPAYLFEKSALNERMETVLGTRIGDVKIVQLAGLVARRILSLTTIGKAVVKGDPLGLIKLGSRVDLWLPSANAEVTAFEGQRVRIGDAIATVRA
jgi:phosphatidylserine decarboxylase